MGNGRWMARQSWWLAASRAGGLQAASTACSVQAVREGIMSLRMYTSLNGVIQKGASSADRHSGNQRCTVRNAFRLLETIWIERAQSPKATTG
eukprot:2307222-Amphidinium_carterae.1